MLARLAKLKARFASILHEHVNDILQLLATPNSIIRQQAVALALDLVTGSSVDALVTAFRKHLLLSQSSAAGANGAAAAGAAAGAEQLQQQQRSSAEAFRKLLIEALHRCAVQFPSVVPAVAPTLIAFLSEPTPWVAALVVQFLREVAEEHPALRPELLARLAAALASVRSAAALRGALWILGEYAGVSEGVTDAALSRAVAAVAAGAESGLVLAEAAAAGNAARGCLSALLAATEPLPITGTGAVPAEDGAAAGAPVEGSPLRVMLAGSEPFLATAVATCAAKLLLRLRKLSRALRAPVPLPSPRDSARALLLATSLLTVAAPVLSTDPSAPRAPQEVLLEYRDTARALEHDSAERLLLCLRTMMSLHNAAAADGGEDADAAIAAADALLTGGRESYLLALQDQRRRTAAAHSSSSSSAGAGAAAGGTVGVDRSGVSGADTGFGSGAREAASAAAALGLPASEATVGSGNGDGSSLASPVSSGKSKTGGAIARAAAAAAAAAAAVHNSGTVAAAAEVDAIISIRQLRRGADAAVEADMGEGDGDGSGSGAGNTAVNTADDLDVALHGRNTRSVLDLSKLDRVFQLTGYGDPVYAEAQATVLEFDLLLDVTLVNQTGKLLQNVGLELHTSSDIRLVDRPQRLALPAQGSVTVQCAFKLLRTESGTVLGNLSFDSPRGGSEAQTVICLNPVQIDILDFILPASCADAAFRTMWAEFKWENKITVNTDITSPTAFLAHVIGITHMRCLTPPTALAGACSFLSANLCAQSIFGETALMNLSVERTAEGTLAGYMRIRAVTRGIALGLGGKLMANQRAAKANNSLGGAAAPLTTIQVQAGGSE
mgnify:CR=1 FL=1